MKRCVTSGSNNCYCNLPIARVGDTVTYADGSEAVIMDGAGMLTTIDHRPAALVGSRLSNGDRIVSTIWEHAGVFVENGTHVEGLFDPDYVPPPREPLLRFAVHGATTLRGGVLKEATSEYRAEGKYTAARINDSPHREGHTATSFVPVDEHGVAIFDN